MGVLDEFAPFEPFREYRQGRVRWAPYFTVLRALVKGEMRASVETVNTDVQNMTARLHETR